MRRRGQDFTLTLCSSKLITVQEQWQLYKSAYILNHGTDMSCYAVCLCQLWLKKIFNNIFWWGLRYSYRAVKRTRNLKTKPPVKLWFSGFFFADRGTIILVSIGKVWPKLSVRNLSVNTQIWRKGYSRSSRVVVLHTNICCTTKQNKFNSASEISSHR